MRNLIYQFWDNSRDGAPPLPGVLASKKNIEAYAKRIGAEYKFELNPPYLHNRDFALYYGTFNPIFREEFHEYDNVLFLDADTYTIDGLDENIFETFSGDIGYNNDPLQPILRANTKIGKLNSVQQEIWVKSVEQKWNIKIPRTDKGLPKVCSSGIVLYSNEGMKKAKDFFIPFEEYVDHVLSTPNCLPFFGADQDYLQVCLEVTKDKIDAVEIDSCWNEVITYHERDATRVVFDKDENTKIVHVSFRGGYHHTEEELWRITNLPVEEWNVTFPRKNVVNEIKRYL